MADNEKIDVVDEKDEVLRVEDRSVVRSQQLLHRGAGVIFYTPNKEVILQLRSKDKKIFPGLLDYTASGGVPSGYSYLQAAIMETEEETGLKLAPTDLKLLNKVRQDFKDQLTGLVNNVFFSAYSYCYLGDIASLQVEIGKAQGFQLWPIETLLSLSEAEKEKFIPGVVNENSMMLYKQILEIN